MARAPAAVARDRGAARGRPAGGLSASARDARSCSATSGRARTAREPSPPGACITPGCWPGPRDRQGDARLSAGAARAGRPRSAKPPASGLDVAAGQRRRRARSARCRIRACSCIRRAYDQKTKRFASRRSRSTRCGGCALSSAYRGRGRLARRHRRQRRRAQRQRRQRAAEVARGAAGARAVPAGRRPSRSACCRPSARAAGRSTSAPSAGRSAPRRDRRRWRGRRALRHPLKPTGRRLERSPTGSVRPSPDLGQATGSASTAASKGSSRPPDGRLEAAHTLGDELGSAAAETRD